MADLIEAIRSRAEAMAAHDFRGTRRMSEADTKRILIQPILEALGWDFRTRAEVAMEHTIFGPARGKLRRVGYVDYALMIQGKVWVTVEAKALAHELNDLDMMQAIQYAQLAGARACLLTNGREYEIHHIDPGTGESGLIGVGDIAGTEPVHLEALLGRLRKDRIEVIDGSVWDAPMDAPLREPDERDPDPEDDNEVSDPVEPDRDEHPDDAVKGLIDLGELVLDCIRELDADRVGVRLDSGRA